MNVFDNQYRAPEPEPEHMSPEWWRKVTYSTPLNKRQPPVVFPIERQQQPAPHAKGATP